MPSSHRGTHYLFVKKSLQFPRTSGHDVHTYHLMRALIEQGHKVSLAAEEAPSPQATEGLDLASCRDWRSTRSIAALPGLQERFRSYWGIENEAIAAIADHARDCQADVVVAVGLDVLPLLAGVQGPQRVWYAADEWVWHHLSVVRWNEPSTWSHVKTAMIKGLYEYSFRNVVDRAWVVSEADRRAMRLFAGIRNVDVVPNGVDTEHYRPAARTSVPKSCVFWGRLDFEPNIQALQWFCRSIWPSVLLAHPDAQLRLFGCQPTAGIKELTTLQGVSLAADLPDLRPEIDRSQVVVLPFQSGGGVKNKLLEAASMAKPIVCSPRACNGLMLPEKAPLVVVDRVTDWVAALSRLWSDDTARERLGSAARNWVIERHSWDHAAELAVAGLDRSTDRWPSRSDRRPAPRERSARVRTGFPAWL